MSDNKDLGTTARRLAKVGVAVGGVAARVAGEKYLGLKFDKLVHATDLKEALGGLKGPLMKVAQILSTIPNALPEEYSSQLAELQANAPSMGWPFVKRRMTIELGDNWSAQFKEFSKEASSAASLGQVHKGVSLDGEDVACKLQYPEMDSVVRSDLRQLKLIFSIYKRYDKAINPERIYDELAQRLWEELDYELETSHMTLYNSMLKDEVTVHVPKPISKLSTKRLLTMTWLEGEPLLSVVKREPSLETRNQIALSMFRAWYVPFYYYGIIHGDPHLGNYTVRKDNSINLLDFGCVRVFRPGFVRGVIDLYSALKNDDMDLAISAYETWGFQELSQELIEVLNMWAKFVYAPLLDDRIRPIQDSKSRHYGAEVALEVRKELNKIGGIAPPPEFVLMDRAAVGLGSVFTHLEAEINWHDLFHELINDFNEKEVQKRQAKALKFAGIKFN